MHDNTGNAQRVFNKFCGALDKCGISYQKDDEELSVSCRFKGNDLVIPATIDFLKDFELMVIHSQLPCIVPVERRVEFALAVAAVNSLVIGGSFDYNVDTDGAIAYRTGFAFADSDPDEKTLLYMVKTACEDVDKYNDKFAAFLNGTIGITEILTQ